MPRFRLILEFDANDKTEATDHASALCENNQNIEDWKLQRVYGKRVAKTTNLKLAKRVCYA